MYVLGYSYTCTESSLTTIQQLIFRTKFVNPKTRWMVIQKEKQYETNHVIIMGYNGVISPH